MVRDLMAARIVHVGETHDAMAMHEIEFQVIRALYAQRQAPGHRAGDGAGDPPGDAQQVDRGHPDERGVPPRDPLVRHLELQLRLLREDLRLRPGAPAAHLRPERAARGHHQDPDARLGRAERRGEGLLPGTPDVTNQDHRTLIRAVFESSDLPAAMKGPGLDSVFEGLYRSQSAWDEVMGAERRAGRRGRGATGRRLRRLGASPLQPRPQPTGLRAVEAALQDRRCRRSPGREEEPDRLAGHRPTTSSAWPRKRRRPFRSIGLGLKKIDGLENLVVDPKPTDGCRRPGRVREGGRRPLGRRQGLHRYQRAPHGPGQA
ncbi:MAG: hypothetical protein M0C28_04170 [Candidatus Moduliflexus flocculans]|nr:hypothetical protein [Candidatus Moduliflexus flocculans]